MDEHEQEQVGVFCRTTTDRQGADSVAVWAKDATGMVLDIGEFLVADHGDRLIPNVQDWIDGWSLVAGTHAFELRAMRKTGERCGADDVWDTISTMTIGG